MNWTLESNILIYGDPGENGTAHGSVSTVAGVVGNGVGLTKYGE